MGTEKKSYIIIAFITVLGFIFRIVGINFGLPQVFHPDEPFIVERANTMAVTGDLNPHFFIYPSLLIYIYCLFFKIEHILLDSVTRSILYLTARSFNALLGALMIPLTYISGTGLYNKKVGILSSAFMAFAPLAVENSHYATVDIPLTFFILLAFLFIVRIIYEGSKVSCILSGCLIGLASSVKYTGGLLVVPLLTAFIIRCKTGSSINLVEFRKLLLAFATSLLFFLITTPYSILDFNNFKEDLLYISGHVKGTHGVLFKEEPSGYIYHLQASLSSGLTPSVEILSIAGILFIIVESIFKFRSKEVPSHIMLLSWTLPYYLIIGSWGNLFPRYVIPLLPFLLIAVAYLLYSFSSFVYSMSKSRFRKEIFTNSLLLILTVVLIVNPIDASIKTDRNFLKNDTRQISYEWIEENIPANSIIFKEYYTPEIEMIGKYLVNNFGINLAENNKEDIIEADYLIVSSGVYDRYYRKPAVSEKEIAFYEYLKKNLKLLKEFKPDSSTKGPTIKIYSNGEIRSSSLLKSDEIGNCSNFYVSKGLIEFNNCTISIQEGFVGWNYFLEGDERYINIIHKGNNVFGLLIATKKKDGGFMNTQSWIIPDIRKAKHLNLEGGWLKTSIPLPATLKGTVKVKVFKQDGNGSVIIKSIEFE